MPRKPSAAVRLAAFAAPLFLAGCASDPLSLAPPDPAKPWPLPHPSTAASKPVLPAEATGALAAPAPNATSVSADAAPAAARENAVVIDPNRRYALDELIDLAERSNPETHEAWEKARQAALAVGLAQSAYAPQIAAEVIGGFQHTPLPIPASLISRGYFTSDTRELLPTLSVKWLLFDFGRRANTEAAARANAFVADVAFTGVHHKLIFEVSRDYFALDAARAKLRVAEQALKNATIVEDAVGMRRAHGLATTVDVAQAKRQTAQARFDVERTTGASRAAYAALIASMGVAPTAPLAVADSAQLTLPTAPSQNVDRLVEQALSDRPDLIAAAGKIRAAEANLEKERSDYYPTVSLSAQGYQNLGGLSADGSRYYSVNEPGGSILLQLSWSLFDGGARDARSATARSEIAAAHDSLSHAQDLAVKQVTDSYDALKTGLAEHAAAIALRDAARTAYDAALDAYRHGVGTYLDLVHDETALTQADSEFEDARANALSAGAALAFSTGAIVNEHAGR